MNASARKLCDQALASIRAHQADALGRGVELLGVVGSVARGEAGPESDVDVAYAIIGDPSLFDLGGILMDIQEDVGRSVDLINLARVKPRLRAEMERDLVRA